MGLGCVSGVLCLGGGRHPCALQLLGVVLVYFQDQQPHAAPAKLLQQQQQPQVSVFIASMLTSLLLSQDIWSGLVIGDATPYSLWLHLQCLVFGIIHNTAPTPLVPSVLCRVLCHAVCRQPSRPVSTV